MQTNPLQSAKAELAELLERKTEIERRIDAIEQTIRILEPVYGGDQQKPLYSGNATLNTLMAAMSEDDPGLTDRIRTILQVSMPTSVTPTGMRDWLVRTGFQAEGRSNFLAEIHNILKRLVAQGDAEDVSQVGIKAYRAAGARPLMQPLSTYGKNK